MNEDELARRLEVAGNDRGPGDELRALLADASVWAEPDPGGADALLAAIRAEQRGGDLSSLTPDTRGGRRQTGWRRWQVVAAAAALVVVVAATTALVVRDDGTGDRLRGDEFAIAGTPLAPDASAVATVADEPGGVAIALQVQGLAGAEPGTYYEAWVANGTDAVSAGSFHMRGGDGWIYLWSGIEADRYPMLFVTLESEGGGPERSGDIVLTGPISP